MASKKKPQNKALSSQVIEIWDRRDTESEPAFAAFMAYREMGLDRSIRAVAAKLERSLTLIGGWSSKHDWPARAAAWDRQLDSANRSGQLAEARRQGTQMQRRHSRVARLSLRIAEVELTRQLNLIQGGVRVEGEFDETALPTLELGEVRKLAETMVKLERLVEGEPEAIVENREATTWAEKVKMVLAAEDDKGVVDMLPASPTTVVDAVLEGEDEGEPPDDDA